MSVGEQSRFEPLPAPASSSIPRLTPLLPRSPLPRSPLPRSPLLSPLPHIATHQLGKDDDEPEYSFGSWFAMLFTCGVATRLWYYTAESVWHYKGTGERAKLRVDPVW